MLPGPDHIIACPDCGLVARVFSIVSGNTFHGEFWTDNYAFFGMLPRPPEITQCPKCNKYYWLSEAIVLGYLECSDLTGSDDSAAEKFIPDPDSEMDLGQLLSKNDIANGWANVHHIEKLTEEQFLEIAGLSGDNPEAELFLRMKAWWTSNDPFREGMEHLHVDRGVLSSIKRRFGWGEGCSLSGRSSMAQENVERVIALLDADIDGLILKGEANRELGWLDLASDCLNQASAMNAGIVALETEQGHLSDAEMRELTPNLSRILGDDYYDTLPIRRAAEARIRNRCRIERIADLVRERDVMVRRLEFPDDDTMYELVKKEMQSITGH